MISPITARPVKSGMVAQAPRKIKNSPTKPAMPGRPRLANMAAPITPAKAGADARRPP